MPASASSPSSRTSSSSDTCGIAKRSPAVVTTSAGMMASVSGILILRVVPWPATLCTSTVPPIFSMLVFTTSMPTPRPEMLLTCSAVLKPGAKIRFTSSRSPIRAACSAVMTPFWIALAFTRSVLTPPPSSEISMLTCPPSW